jgi:SAM-dependent methyltransferase
MAGLFEPQEQPKQPPAALAVPQEQPKQPQTLAAKSKKSATRAALIKLAKERFEAQQAAAGDAALVAPISPSPPELVRDILAALAARGTLTKDGSNAPRRVVDLGCGDARWLVAACEHYDCVGVGYDLDEALLARGRDALARRGLAGRATLERRDFFDGAPLLAAGDVVVAYLFREGCAKLLATLEAELERGVVVCVGFELRGWKCAFERSVRGLKVRVYDVGSS